MNTAYVTSKGQLVVPSHIRRRYGIKPGTRINFVEEGDRIIFQPVTKEYINSFAASSSRSPARNPSCRNFWKNAALKRPRKTANENHGAGRLRNACHVLWPARRGDDA